MTHVRLPPGVRDYLPVAAARRRGIVSALSAELERWGYRSIITPIYEYDEVLARGLGDHGRAMRLVEPSTGEVLALRPDLTAQVARLVATRLHDEPGPLRLAYQGSVVRLPGPSGGQGELFQVGVELIDAPQPGGDLEIVMLAEAALRAAGVGEVTIDLGHADLPRAALDGLPLDAAGAAALEGALLRKDAARVAEVARGLAVPARRKELLCALPTLYGGPEVLSRARKLVSGIAPEARRALDELETLIERLGSCLPEGRARLSIDLGEVRGFQYYTGTRFAAYAGEVGGALASGGRYDRLIERFGRPARATGFAVDVDRVGEVLKARGVPAPEPSGGLYIGGDPVLAARLAARLRASGLRAVLELDEPAARDQDGRLKERARRFRLERVVLVARDRLRWFDVEPPGAKGSLQGAALKKLLAEDGALDALVPPR